MNASEDSCEAMVPVSVLAGQCITSIVAITCFGQPRCDVEFGLSRTSVILCSCSHGSWSCSGQQGPYLQALAAKFGLCTWSAGSRPAGVVVVMCRCDDNKTWYGLSRPAGGRPAGFYTKGNELCMRCAETMPLMRPTHLLPCECSRLFCSSACV